MFRKKSGRSSLPVVGTNTTQVSFLETSFDSGGKESGQFHRQGLEEEEQKAPKLQEVRMFSLREVLLQEAREGRNLEE